MAKKKQKKRGGVVRGISSVQFDGHDVEVCGPVVFNDTPVPTIPAAASYTAVNTPRHYTYGAVEPDHVVDAWRLDYFAGSAVRHLCRTGLAITPAEELVDVRKALAYLRKLEDRLEQRALDSK